jgi:hypothetical protein
MTSDDLLKALLNSNSIENAAFRTDIPERSLKKMMRTSPFKNSYGNLRDSSICQSVAKLNAFAPACIDTLVNIAGDVSASPNARISAARSVLTIALKMTETADILERIDLLESGDD